jgi:starch synthase
LHNTATGFVFDAASAAGFQWCVERAIAQYRHPEQWSRIQARAVTEDFSWERSAAGYLDLYRGLMP